MKKLLLLTALVAGGAYASEKVTFDDIVGAESKLRADHPCLIAHYLQCSLTLENLLHSDINIDDHKEELKALMVISQEYLSKCKEETMRNFSTLNTPSYDTSSRRENSNFVKALANEIKKLDEEINGSKNENI